MKPFAPIPLAPEQNNPRHERAQGGGGGTVWTGEAVAHAAESNRSHKEWLATEAGAAWFAAQPWNAGLPLVRVRKLGWQPGLGGGGGVMLYNRIDGGSTVTLGSLVKQGCRIEVVG